MVRNGRCEREKIGVACGTPSRQRVWQREQTGARTRRRRLLFSFCVLHMQCIYVYIIIRTYGKRTKETNRDEATRCGLMRLPRTWPNASATRSQCCNVPRAIFRFSNLLVAPSVYCFSLPFSLLFTPLLSSLVIAFYVMFL